MTEGYGMQIHEALIHRPRKVERDNIIIIKKTNQIMQTILIVTVSHVLCGLF